MVRLELNLGHRKLLSKATGELQKDSKSGPAAVALLHSAAVTTKSLAKDGGLDEILKKIKGILSIDNPLLTLGVVYLFNLFISNDFLRAVPD